MSLIVTSDIGIESSIASFAKFLCKAIKVNIEPVNNLRNPEYLNTLDLTNINLLILFGDYWSDLSVIPENVETYNIKFDKPLDQVWKILYNHKLTKYELKDDGLYGLRLEIQSDENGNMVHIPRPSHSTLIELINARVCSHDTEKTQPIIIGIFNYQPELTAYEKYLLLFKEEISLNVILTLGNNILRSQLGLVKDRVTKNSRTGIFNNGTSYAVAEAPELVNLTHEELHRQYPDCPVTITISFKLSDKEDQVHHSIRSWSSDINAKEIIGSYGGGSASAAGGRRNIYVNIDY